MEAIKAGTTEWQDARSKGIGASEFPIICGLNPLCSPLELWCQKTGRAPRKEVNDAMWLGTKIEPIIGDYFVRKTGIEIEPDVGGKLYVHPEHPWVFATPDFGLKGKTEGENGEVVQAGEGTGLLECKNTSFRALATWQEAIPFSAQAQLQVQLACTGLRWGYVAGLVGAAELIYEPFEYSDDIVSQLFELGEKFWKLVQTDTPPAATANDADIVEQIIGKRNKGFVDLPMEAYPLVEEYLKLQKLNRELEANVKPVDEKFRAVKNKLAQAVGPNEGATFDGGRIKVKPVIVQPYMNKGSRYTLVTVTLDKEGGDE